GIRCGRQAKVPCSLFRPEEPPAAPLFDRGARSRTARRRRWPPTGRVPPTQSWTFATWLTSRRTAQSAELRSLFRSRLAPRIPQAALGRGAAAALTGAGGFGAASVGGTLHS